MNHLSRRKWGAGVFYGSSAAIKIPAAFRAPPLCSGFCLPNSFLGIKIDSYRKVLVVELDIRLNQRIIEIRQALGLSQKEFAEGIDISRAYQGNIELKQRKVNDRLVRMICLIYGVNEDWLRNGNGTMFDKSIDFRVEQLCKNFKQLDDILQEYALKYLDMLVDYQRLKRKETRPLP
jgi:transcriptional regulator with XRE-family HTH domain